MFVSVIVCTRLLLESAMTGMTRFFEFELLVVVVIDNEGDVELPSDDEMIVDVGTLNVMKFPAADDGLAPADSFDLMTTSNASK